MRMRPIGALRLAPTGRTELRPGGVHLMLMGMKQPLNGGDSFPMTLLFEKAGTKTITVPVKVMGRVDPADLKDKTTVHDTHNHAH
jgi:copper(I)-binding protein